VLGGRGAESSGDRTDLAVPAWCVLKAGDEDTSPAL